MVLLLLLVTHPTVLVLIAHLSHKVMQVFQLIFINIHAELLEALEDHAAVHHLDVGLHHGLHEVNIALGKQELGPGRVLGCHLVNYCVEAPLEEERVKGGQDDHLGGVHCALRAEL